MSQLDLNERRPPEGSGQAAKGYLGKANGSDAAPNRAESPLVIPRPEPELVPRQRL